MQTFSLLFSEREPRAKKEDILTSLSTPTTERNLVVVRLYVLI